jgi:hypothetical protein
MRYHYRMSRRPQRQQGSRATDFGRRLKQAIDGHPTLTPSEVAEALGYADSTGLDHWTSGRRGTAAAKWFAQFREITGADLNWLICGQEAVGSDTLGVTNRPQQDDTLIPAASVGREAGVTMQELKGLIEKCLVELQTISVYQAKRAVADEHHAAAAVDEVRLVRKALESGGLVLERGDSAGGAKR